MELATRMVFVDTSGYEKKNYQFGQHALGKLEKFVEEKKLYLVITDVTRREILSHLQKKSEEAASKLKKLKKEAMFLRNVPELPCFGVFEENSQEKIYEIVEQKFLKLLSHCNAEELSVSEVNPGVVFDAYFNNQPPFDKESKKHEFPDAFALEVIKKVAEDRGHSIYIVSGDGDMKSFADKEESLIPLNSVDELIDLIVRNDEALTEPSNFADEIFESLEAEIIESVKNYIVGNEIISELITPYDDEVLGYEVDNVSILKKNLQSVTSEEAEYELELEVTVTARYIFSDYDRSPWDPEDKKYMFVLNNEATVRHIELKSGYLYMSFQDGIKSNGEVSEFEFDDGYFELTEDKIEYLEYKELDINGE